MIRKIIIGSNPKDAMAYVVGHEINGSIIKQIELDERTLALTGRSEYLIYIQNSEGVMPWKRIEGLPVIVEYDCNF